MKKNTLISQHRQTITLLVGLMFIFFSMSFVSCWEFDNLKTYDKETKTITITNSFLKIYPLGEVATIKLNTPLVYNVIRGKDRLVAEFTIDNFETYKEGVFDDMDFYDVSPRDDSGEPKDNLNKFDRQFNYKYKTFYEIEVADSEIICKERKVWVEVNKTFETEIYGCEQIQTGTHTEQKVKWNSFDKKTELPKGEITLGIFTDVLPDEKVEWIPTLFGVEINEWARWTESLGVGLISYWDLDENTGTNVEDIHSHLSNGTAINSPVWVDGILNNALNFSGITGLANYVNVSNGDRFDFGHDDTRIDFSVQVWVNQSVVYRNAPFLGKMGSSVKDGWYFVEKPTTGYITFTIVDNNGDTCFKEVIGNDRIDDSLWHHVVATVNMTDNNITLYLDGSITASGVTTCLNTTNFDDGNALKMNGYRDDFTGRDFTELDEIAIWNRTLNQADVTQLYNGGAGITYTDGFIPSINITYPLNTTYAIDITELNYSVTKNNSDSCWYSLNNGNTNSSKQDWGLNWTGLTSTEGSNTWTVYCNDTYGSENSTSTTFFKDTLNPSINITYPLNQSYTTNVSDLNYTYIEASCDSVWYSLDSGITNSSRENCGTNWTGLTSSEGSNTWTVYINCSLGCNNQSSVTFFKDSIPPVISINYPENITYTTNVSEINYTYTETNCDSVWYSLDSGITNSSRENCGTNWTGLSSTEGSNTWTVYCNDSSNNENSTSITFFKDSINPQINISYPITFINHHEINTNLTFNWTVSDANLGSCWYIYGGTNTTKTCNDLNISLLISNYSDKTFSFYVNDTVGNVANDSVTWDYYVFENNQTFNNNTMEGNLESFLANIFKHSSVTISKVILVYNSTNYTGESYASGDSTILRKQNLLIPSVTADTNKTFYWDLIFSNDIRINLTANNQTTLNLGMDNCTTYTTRILNLTVEDEELQTSIANATIETAVNLYSYDRSVLILNVSGTYGNPTGICLSLNLTSDIRYSLDTIIKYEATGFATEYYNIVNFTLTNNTETQDITLYDLNSSDSTEFQLTFTGSDFLVVENALVYVNRQYIAENKFKTVELPKTDSNGQTILNLVRNNIIYNMIVIKDGATLGTFNNIIAFCEDYSIGDCKINLNAFDSVESVFDYDTELGITFTQPSFDETTRIITFDFLSTDGTPKDVLMNVTRHDIFGNRTVCEDSLTSAGGTLTCTVDSNIDESILRISVYVDGVDTASSMVELDSSNYGVGGYLVFFIMAISFILIFSESKTGVLVGIILAFVSAVGMNLISDDVIGIGASGLWLILIILLAIWKLNKERIQ